MPRNWLVSLQKWLEEVKNSENHKWSIGQENDADKKLRLERAKEYDAATPTKKN